jgi:hypothetical protein
MVLISSVLSSNPQVTLSHSIAMVGQPSLSRKIGAKMTETGAVRAISQIEFAAGSWLPVARSAPIMMTAATATANR